MAILNRLMSLTFTHNIERLDGNVDSNDLFCLTCGIADGSPEKFINLKFIPSKLVTDVYLNTLLKFKESLNIYRGA